MNLFQNNLYKNEFIITDYDEIDSEGGGFTFLTASNEFSINAQSSSASSALVAAILFYGAADILSGYSVQVV